MFRDGVLIVLSVIMLVIAAPSLAKFSLVNTASQLDLFVDVRHEIVDQFVEAPDEQAMMEAAVHGMVEALDDPYTVYLSPDDLDMFDKQVRGSFSGIGAEVNIEDDYLHIITPLEGSPAWKAGVLPGDIVLEIDGESTKGMNINDAVDRLTGEAGTDVTILARHASGDEATITITRDRIIVPTIKGLLRGADHHWDYMVDPSRGIGYIRIAQFTDKTATDLASALTGLMDRGMKGLILDVRFNPGGLLESAVRTSDMFLDEGQRIVSVKGRKVKEQGYDATSDTVVPMDMPIVIVANEGSASAAEILTGALTDNKRAKFVGTRTFGKGSVQQVRMLESGLGAIKITNAYYYLPNGRKIHRVEDAEQWGVDPEEGFYVSMSAEQVKDMVIARRERDILDENDGQEAMTITPESVESEMKDIQLAAALRAIYGRLDTGEWVEVGASGVSELVKARQRDLLIRQRDLLENRLGEIKDELAVLDGKLPKEVAEDAGVIEKAEEVAETAEMPVESGAITEPAGE